MSELDGADISSVVVPDHVVIIAGQRKNTFRVLLVILPVLQRFVVLLRRLLERVLKC